MIAYSLCKLRLQDIHTLLRKAFFRFITKIHNAKLRMRNNLPTPLTASCRYSGWARKLRVSLYNLLLQKKENTCRTDSTGTFVSDRTRHQLSLCEGTGTGNSRLCCQTISGNRQYRCYYPVYQAGIRYLVPAGISCKGRCCRRTPCYP